MEEKEKLHNWEEENRELCFVNMQKNLPVYNLKTEKKDFIFSNVRLYQADDVDKIIKKELNKLKEKRNFINVISDDIEFLKKVLDSIIELTSEEIGATIKLSKPLQEYMKSISE